MAKPNERERAIGLRKEGFSYSEILKEIPVAKSTLSLWLRDVGLATKQKQRLTQKKLAGMRRGWEARHRTKLLTRQRLIKAAEADISKINKHDLFLIGVALYWAEGHKEKQKSSLVELSNSDPKLICLFLKWLLDVCGIQKQDIYFWIFLHETAKDRLNETQAYWSRATEYPIEAFQKVTWKKNKIATERKNTGENYFGLLRVGVRKSTNLNRKIQGWISGINKSCGVV